MSTDDSLPVACPHPGCESANTSWFTPNYCVHCNDCSHSFPGCPRCKFCPGEVAEQHYMRHLKRCENCSHKWVLTDMMKASSRQQQKEKKGPKPSSSWTAYPGTMVNEEWEYGEPLLELTTGFPTCPACKNETLKSSDIVDKDETGYDRVQCSSSSCTYNASTHDHFVMNFFMLWYEHNITNKPLRTRLRNYKREEEKEKELLLSSQP